MLLQTVWTLWWNSQVKQWAHEHILSETLCMQYQSKTNVSPCPYGPPGSTSWSPCAAPTLEYTTLKLKKQWTEALLITQARIQWRKLPLALHIIQASVIGMCIKYLSHLITEFITEWSMKSMWLYEVWIKHIGASFSETVNNFLFWLTWWYKRKITIAKLSFLCDIRLLSFEVFTRLQEYAKMGRPTHSLIKLPNYMPVNVQFYLRLRFSRLLSRSFSVKHPSCYFSPLMWDWSGSSGCRKYLFTMKLAAAVQSWVSQRILILSPGIGGCSRQQSLRPFS